MLRSFKNSCLFFNHKRCLLCQLKHKGKQRICKPCQQTLPWLKAQCLRCALPLRSENNLCPACLRKTPYFDRVYCGFTYSFPIDALIPPGKFNNRTDYLEAICELTIASVCISEKPDCLIPVPMHPRKILSREYNHAWILARKLSQTLDIPLRNDLLIKSMHTADQRDLNAVKRRQNLRNSFSCTKTPPLHVMLVDDVITTGTTANMISKILRQAGCKRVDIFALARTDKPSSK